MNEGEVAENRKNIEVFIHDLETTIARYKGRLISESLFLVGITEAITRYVERLTGVEVK